MVTLIEKSMVGMNKSMLTMMLIVVVYITKYVFVYNGLDKTQVPSMPSSIAPPE